MKNLKRLGVSVTLMCVLACAAFDVILNGLQKSDRTGVGTRSVFGRPMSFDLSEGFPSVTTEKLHLKSIIYELLWFLRGDTRWQSTARTDRGNRSQGLGVTLPNNQVGMLFAQA
jgi:hypothetical protein